MPELLCAACNRPATLHASVACCEEHQGNVTAALSILKPEQVSPQAAYLSMRRMAALRRSREIARMLSEVAFVLGDTGYEDAQVESVMERVAEAWDLVQSFRTSRPKNARDLVSILQTRMAH